MQAPQYINRNHNLADHYQAARIHAIRFIKEMPSSHWFVNFGHPRIKLLRNLYWVQTRTGPVEIHDGQWVVLSENDGLSTMDDDDFIARYQPLSDYE